MLSYKSVPGRCLTSKLFRIETLQSALDDSRDAFERCARVMVTSSLRQQPVSSDALLDV